MSMDKAINIAQSVANNFSQAEVLFNDSHTYEDARNINNEMVKNPKVLAELILKKSAVSASITIPVRDYNTGGLNGYTATIPFYMSGDFTLGMGNNWGDTLDLSSLQQLSHFINVAHGTVGHGEAHIAIQSEPMSAQVWKGSTFDGFNVECLFVCTNRQFNTLKILNILAATCLPTRAAEQPPSVPGAGLQKAKDVVNNTIGTVQKIGTGLLKGAQEHLGWDTSKAQESVTAGCEGAQQYINSAGVIAPLNYGLKKGQEGNMATQDPLPNSTVTLQIGDYFRANNLLVTSLSGVALSKEIVGPPTFDSRGANDLYDNTPTGSDWGFPLYFKCQLKLRPHAMMHYAKWQDYFLFHNNYQAAMWRPDYILQLPQS